ncbi:trem-like transcript 4 protein [Sarcophilus harrisii]|uniref:Ig-like domain-containing protein n=1 Tax=Sarcophilus harrisii TaxID=9305 RepID=G3VN58_SARHA|nr:trem-like transcript 4 protein [Sarcophilus harrisii]
MLLEPLLMERSKMIPEVPLHLVLLLLWVSYEKGSLGKEEEYKVVGETLTVRCQYTPEKPDHLDKAWCKKIENENSCTLLITRPKSWAKTENLRYSLSYNISVITVNMSGLQVEDSGEYWCGRYNSTRNIIDILKRVHLIVAPAQTQKTIQQKLTTIIEATTITSVPTRSQFNITGRTYLMYTNIQLPENSTSRSQSMDHIGFEDLKSPNCLLTLALFGLILTKALAFLILLILLFRFRHQVNGDTGKVTELNKLELSKISFYPTPDEVPDVPSAAQDIK